TTSIPFRRAGKRVIDDASVAMRQRRDLGHLGVGELEVEDREIFRQPLDPAGARDDGDALLHQEAQAHLRGGLRDLVLLMGAADARQNLVVLPPAAGDGAVGHDRHVMSTAGRDHSDWSRKGCISIWSQTSGSSESFTASSINPTVKFDTPIWRASPMRLTLQSAPSVSDRGICGFGQCSR